MTDYSTQLVVMTGPQLIESWNEMCATAHELGVPGADELREVTKFATLLAARTRCASLHRRIEDQRMEMTREDADARASGTIKALDGEDEFDADDSGAREHVVTPGSWGKADSDLARAAATSETFHVTAVPVTPAEHTQAVVAQVRARAARAKKTPTYTMASTIQPAATNPYEEGTERHGIFAGIRAGMTVREFCADHGKYPRALNFLNPLLREGAVTLRTLVHGVEK